MPKAIKEGDTLTDIYGKPWKVFKTSFGSWCIRAEEDGKVGFLEQWLINNNKDFRFIYEQ